MLGFEKLLETKVLALKTSLPEKSWRRAKIGTGWYFLQYRPGTEAVDPLTPPDLAMQAAL
jgi:hypothetical protein